MYERIRNDAGRTTMICVDSYENGVPKGRFYNYGRPDEGQKFSSLMQLIVSMEQILDSANYPQSFTAVRTFAVPSEPKTAELVDAQNRKGALATFVVKVLFRQHTSWQGSVSWQEAKSEMPFRSVLELILLMESALSSAEKSE
ncbi:MAG: hypothetical protein IJD81_08820 [Oscillospiraceae bacterium]|nr:hypothetical protein [Oscillospiraceae bacterium]